MRKKVAERVFLGVLMGVLAVSMALGGLAITSPTAEAQGTFALQDTNLIPTCAAYEGALGVAGFAEIHVKDLRALTEPNPPAVAAALDTLQQADAVLPGQVEVPLSEVIAASDVLTGYFGPPCSSLFSDGGFFRVSGEVCAAYGRATNTGGEFAVLAIKDLRSFVEPAPATLARALDTLQDAESDIPPSGSRPSPDVADEARNFVVGYFDLRCSGIDICFWVAAALDERPSVSADGARIARGLTTPAPPGIDAAFALISGASSSPFHASVMQAQEQIRSFFPCGPFVLPIIFDSDLELCADLNVLGIPEGPRAAAAAERIRAAGSPNPPGIENALDVLVAFSDFSNPVPPSLDQADAAYQTLLDYFGGVCNDIDRCPLVELAVAGSPDSAAAAGLLRRLETPSPPGIDASLALIAGEIQESPFHNSVAEAVQQIDDYYSCTKLAITGSTSVFPLASLGVSLIALGGFTLIGRRRL